MPYPDNHISKKHFRIGIIAIIQVLLFSLLARAHGVVFTVDRLTDNYTFNGEGSGTSGDLRYCVRQANLHNDYVFFTFGLTGTIYLNAPLPAITINESLYGTNAHVTISGQNLYPVFTVAKGAFASFTDLIIVDGFQPSGSGGGGAIVNYGDIAVNNCIFKGHISNTNGGALSNKNGAKVQLYNCTFGNNFSAGYGGAINNDTGSVIINGCFFERDSSTMGGGAINDNGGMTLTNSTFIENAAGNGATAYQAGNDTSHHYVANCTFYSNGAKASGYQPAIANYAFLTLVNNTIYNNKGGGVHNENAAILTMVNTIVVYNGDYNNYNIQGTFTGLSQNNILSTIYNTNLVNNQNGNNISNTVIGTLFATSLPGLNQGSIPTLALSDNSPAIDAGVSTINGINIPTTDERGFNRIGPPDIGAYENIKQKQSIVFLDIEDKHYGDLVFIITATATSGLIVNYSISGPGIISGDTISVTGIGVLTVTAIQQGNDNYKAASSNAFINVSKAAQTITGFTFFPDIVFSDIPNILTLTGTVVSGLPLIFSVAGPASLQGNNVTITGTGIVTITAFQFGDNNYLPASPVSSTFTVYKYGQTITGFAPLPDITFTGFGQQLTFSAIATSGLPLVYSATGSALVSGNTLTIIGAGVVTVTAFQHGNESYLPAKPESISFTVHKAWQTITGFNEFPNETLTFSGIYTITLSGISTSGLTVSYQAEATPSDNIATITGNILNLSGQGLVTITAFQHGNENYLPAASLSHILTIKSNETVTGINIEKNNPLVIYPNPGNGFFNVKTVQTNTTFTFNIFNLFGNEVFKGFINNDFVIDLTLLPKGFYYIYIFQGETFHMEKLVIE